MAEYIDKEKVLKRLNDFNEWCKDSRLQGSLFAVDVIKDIPIADVQLVRRGYWKKTNDIFYRYCSECGTKTDIAYSNIAKYCAECGAKMDLPEATKG